MLSEETAGLNNSHSQVAAFDASKLTIRRSATLKSIPPFDELTFGKYTTDHMLVAHFEPNTGWTAPEIIPYSPLTLDPAASCFQYCPTVFEGMKAYLGPDGKPRLFRPELNMTRMQRSAERVALPGFSSPDLINCIKQLVSIESRWIPTTAGGSLYLRPTLVGTTIGLAPTVSDQATLFVIASPVGLFFAVPRPLKLYAEHQYARAWPGGTGAFKLGLNYAPAFTPQRSAIQKGYDQVLWLLDEGALMARVDGDQPETGKPERCRVTEAGAMNVFFVLSRPDSEDLDVITPLLDGTILPGVTRASVLELAAAHPSKAGLDGVPSSVKLVPGERTVTLADIFAWVESGILKEMFSVGTAVTVAPIGALGFADSQDLVLPSEGGSGALGTVGAAIRRRIDDIQLGRYEWDGWSVVCDTA